MAQEKLRVGEIIKVATWVLRTFRIFPKLQSIKNDCFMSEKSLLGSKNRKSDFQGFSNTYKIYCQFNFILQPLNINLQPNFLNKILQYLVKTFLQAPKPIDWSQLAYEQIDL